MATSYALNCLRLVFNSTAPAGFRVAPFKARRLRWSARYRRAACLALLIQLKSRTLTVQQAEALRQMRERVAEAFPNYSDLLQ